MAKARIGTSGWVYPHWQPDFYPNNLLQKEWLSFYSSHFSTVEVNSSFYHQVLPKTYQNWAQNVPGNFTFALKGSRFITHIKRLKDPEEPLKNFFESAKFLEYKLGPILFQLPPKMKADVGRLENFLKILNYVARQQFDLASNPPRKTRSARNGASANENLPAPRSESEAGVLGKPHKLGGLRNHSRVAFEFRDQSWFCKDIYKTLEKYNAGLVIADSGENWPTEEIITANFVYLRFHGEALYSSNYPKGELENWAKKIKKWFSKGLDVYGYFNNDALGYAVENARTLAKMVS